MAFSDKSQTFQKNPAVSLELLARGIEQFLIQREGMVCQILRTPMGYSIQTKKKDDWMKYVLLDNAMQVDLTETDQFIIAQIGGAKWVAKGAALGVGMILAWPIGIPLMALSSIGGFNTINLPKKILEFAEQFLNTNGNNIVIPQEYSAPEYSTPGYSTPSSEAGQAWQNSSATFQSAQYQTASQQSAASFMTCPACKAIIPAGKSFCPDCGASTAPKKTICPKCNSELDGVPTFCPDCGEKLQAEE